MISPLAPLLSNLEIAAKKDGDIFLGFTSLAGIDLSLDPEIFPFSSRLQFAISLGTPLNLSVLQTIEDRPSVIYKHHYQQVNYLLDRAALRLSRILEQESFLALPIPASVYTRRSDLRAHLSHREIAHRAGLGWWRKCNLIVHPRFGAGIRLTTILTDLEFPATPPPDNRCGDCSACARACPAHAIGENNSGFNRSACFAQLREFERKVIGVGICGICVRACREAREKIVKIQKPAQSVAEE